MIKIIKDSFCIKFALKLKNLCCNSYNGSCFKIFVDKFKSICNDSLTHKVIKKYLDKQTVIYSSIFYRGIKFIGRHLGKAADKINDLAVKAYDGSFLKKIITFCKDETVNDKAIAVGLFFMMTSITYLVASVLLGKNYDERIFISWGLFFIGFIAAYGGRNIETVKKSLTFKVIKFLVELVRM